MILVVGATGTLGGRIARGLLELGKDVRILVREPSPSAELAQIGMATSADSLTSAGAQAITADLTDRHSLDAACAGIDTVITTAAATKRDGNIEAVDLEGTLNLVDAATKAGVRHFIYTSASGAAVGHPIPLFHIKGTCEQAVKDSGLRWTILQPSIFPEVWAGMVIGIPLNAGQPITLVGKANHRHSFVSEADVAAFAIAAVDNEAAENSCLEIGGPSYTWSEVVAETGKVMGRTLPVTYVPMGSTVPLLDPMVSDLLTGFETYEDSIDMGTVPEDFSVKLTPLPDALRSIFG
jgi:uncharacterized protein YbjT (DUF2867 family)